MTPTKDFFKKQTASSRIKANIVAEYFPQYCKILLKKPQSQIRYLDLFAGPGKYEDGNHSTPLLLAKYCADDTRLSEKVQLVFNDNEFCDDLKANFKTCFPAETFTFEPRFGNKTVGEDPEIRNFLLKDIRIPNPSPTLLFFDPWGYKGIDTLVLAKFLQGWGNEIFLFVNIKRINQAIAAGKFDELMKCLFPTTIDQIRRDRKYEATNVYERLRLIMENLANEFKNAVKGKLFHCAFKFQEEDSNATSHYIIHFSKDKKGFELVKQVYDDYDNIGAVLENDHTYTFDVKKMDSSEESGLDFGDENVLTLSNILFQKYKGKTLTAKALFDNHHPTTSWCGRHYAETLRDMVAKGSITAIFTDGKEHRKSVILNEYCKLEFKPNGKINN